MLLGLIVLVVGAGVVGASGAFSSVQAERTVDLNTAGDSNALLGLETLDNEIAQVNDGPSSSGDTAVLQFNQEDLNADAKTIFRDAFRITNNGDEDIDQLYIRENTSAGVQDGGTVDFRLGGESTSGATVGNSIVGSGNHVALGAAGGTVEVAVVIDTRGAVTADDLDGISEVTIVANDTTTARDT
jgi:hypothetical protein